MTKRHVCRCFYCYWLKSGECTRKQVPVVSLEWLAKYCETHGAFMINKRALMKAAKPQ